MGVGLRDVDADLERSLKLTVDHGALVQDITAGSPPDSRRPAAVRRDHLRSTTRDRERRPAESGNLRAHARHGRPPARAARRPRSAAHREAGGAARSRPVRKSDPAPAPSERGRVDADNILLGLVVRDIDRQTAERLELPKGTRGVLIHARGADELVVRRRHRARGPCCSRSPAACGIGGGVPPPRARGARGRYPHAVHLRPGSRSASAQDGPARRPLMPKSRVLVIDDEAAIRDSLKDDARVRGLRVHRRRDRAGGARAGRARRARSRPARRQDARPWTASKCWRPPQP